MNRGAFILFEGIDHSGKTTQSSLLAHTLEAEGKPVAHLRFPDRSTSIGTMIDKYLRSKPQEENESTRSSRDRSIHLLFSANRWEVVPTIISLLESGTNVVLDRYAHSGVAYTAAKGYDLDWCKSPDRGLPIPDLVIYLKLRPEEASKRGSYGSERYETIEFQEKVSSAYELLKDSSWRIVDASQSLEQIQSQVRELADSVVSNSVGVLKQGLWM